MPIRFTRIWRWASRSPRRLKSRRPSGSWRLQSVSSRRTFTLICGLAELYQRVGVPKRAKEELQTALDLAGTSAEKKIARDLLAAEEHRDASSRVAAGFRQPAEATAEKMVKPRHNTANQKSAHHADYRDGCDRIADCDLSDWRSTDTGGSRSHTRGSLVDLARSGRMTDIERYI